MAVTAQYRPNSIYVALRDQVERHFLSKEAADAIMQRVVATNEGMKDLGGRDKWNDPASDYQGMMMVVLWQDVKPEAIRWAKENDPNGLALKALTMDPESLPDVDMPPKPNVITTRDELVATLAQKGAVLSSNGIREYGSNKHFVQVGDDRENITLVSDKLMRSLQDELVATGYTPGGHGHGFSNYTLKGIEPAYQVGLELGAAIAARLTDSTAYFVVAEVPKHINISKGVEGSINHTLIEESVREALTNAGFVSHRSSVGDHFVSSNYAVDDRKANFVGAPSVHALNSNGRGHTYIFQTKDWEVVKPGQVQAKTEAKVTMVPAAKELTVRNFIAQFPGFGWLKRSTAASKPQPRS